MMHVETVGDELHITIYPDESPDIVYALARAKSAGGVWNFATDTLYQSIRTFRYSTPENRRGL